ncbi:dihydrofolate reductase family protein [Ilumatobacter nonamiensis]|uniref:dihydrofolate reductase family protein n=1 Tax=Ilumatobacter nonamiensis TaxID=467093 RepID=UPI00034BBBD7|nr:dihydrofolate reductase family protein [Ilumatobacter nonamiensis]
MKLVITQNITLDGVIEVTDATGEWFAPAGGDADMSDLEASLREMMGEQDAQLYGRKTFEAMRGFWPNRTDDTTGITDHLDTVRKYVISTTMTDPEWQNSTVLHGDLIPAVRDLKDQPGSVLGVTGSISVCHALIAADLVDEYRLFVYPTVVSQARRLFDGTAARPCDLELVATQQFRSGIVLLTYRPRTTA